MSDYTKTEAATISNAFGHLMNFLESTDHTATGMLRDALKHERKQRLGLNNARVLLCRSFLQGWTTPAAILSSVYGVSRGCMLAQVCGAGLASFKFARELDVATLRAAVQAHEVAQERAWKALSAA